MINSMSLFEKKRELSRSEFREALRKASFTIPGGGGMFSTAERIKIEKEIFGKQYGGYISKEEYQRRLREMALEKARAKTGAKKLEIDRKIRFLKKLGGI